MTPDEAIRQRRTIKLLSPCDLPVRDVSESLAELIEVAGWAPFHRACDPVHRGAESDLSGIEPWRFYVLDAAACRQLRLRLPESLAGKIPAMLASADALIMATWLPNPPSNQLATERPSESAEVVEPQFTADYPPIFEATLGNMEHIAAASAAVQNLLITATARGMDNYWSSGGVLRSPATFELLGIPVREILLGAIFLFPSPAVSEATNSQALVGADRVASKLREHRTTSECWSRRITLP